MVMRFKAVYRDINSEWNTDGCGEGDEGTINSSSAVHDIPVYTYLPAGRLMTAV